jgi:hypothetical protein
MMLAVEWMNYCSLVVEVLMRLVVGQLVEQLVVVELLPLPLHLLPHLPMLMPMNWLILLPHLPLLLLPHLPLLLLPHQLLLEPLPLLPLLLLVILCFAPFAELLHW